MNRTNLIIFILLVLLGAIGLAIYFQGNPVSEQVIQDIQPTPPPEPIKNPIVHYPVPEADPQPTPEPSEASAEQNDTTVAAVNPLLPKILPPVQESDQSIRDAFNGSLSGKTTIKPLFMKNFIQKLVTTIDNLPEKQLPRAHLPIKAPGGKFLVAGTTEAPQTSSRNHKRYSPYLTLLESIDSDLVIKIYTHFYPLFQEAYEQLGYQNSYFNDRLVYVIDHLLETPNPPDPIQLAQPAVLFTYANPDLEKLSAGQKLLLRIGQKQRVSLLSVLDTYRQKLTTLHP